MIEGLVNGDLKPTVTFTVHGPSGASRTITAVVDTGFNGFLALPPATVGELGLRWESDSDASLADASMTLVDLYGVIVDWGGEDKVGLAVAAGSTPFVGMQLLEDYDLHVECKIGGRVLIEASAA